MTACDSQYFNSYDDINIHQLMLKDTARVNAYKIFIENNRDQFADKVVIDVGSGVGILSLLVARAGAKHVFAVEAAKHIGELSKQIVRQNGCEDRITVIISPVEDVSLPDGMQADVIISEWMGFYLFHESMLNAVITARDKLLKTDGVIFPSSAVLYASPVALKQFHRERFEFWRNVYGFDMTPATAAARASCLARPEIMTVEAQSLLAEPQPVITIDMKYVDKDDVNAITATVDFVFTRNDVMHGFALWFDVCFEGIQPVTLDTSPSSAETHWKQTVALLPDALLVSRSTSLSCRVNLHRIERRYDISIDMIDDDDDEDMEELNHNENVSNDIQDIISSTMKPVA